MNDLVKQAIQHLSESTCSETELRCFLMEKISNPSSTDNLDNAIIYLKKNGLLNDWQFAKRLAQNYTHKGNQFICQLLRRRKIHAHIINAVIASLPSEQIRALQEASRKIKTIKGREEAYILIARFLQGRLFSGKAIKQVLEQILQQYRGFKVSIGNPA